MDKILTFYTCKMCQGRHSSRAHSSYFNIELMSKHNTIYIYPLILWKSTSEDLVLRDKEPCLKKIY